MFSVDFVTTSDGEWSGDGRSDYSSTWGWSLSANNNGWIYGASVLVLDGALRGVGRTGGGPSESA